MQNATVDIIPVNSRCYLLSKHIGHGWGTLRHRPVHPRTTCQAAQSCQRCSLSVTLPPSTLPFVLGATSDMAGIQYGIDLSKCQVVCACRQRALSVHPPPPVPGTPYLTWLASTTASTCPSASCQGVRTCRQCALPVPPPPPAPSSGRYTISDMAGIHYSIDL